MTKDFAPKGADVLKEETVKELNLNPEEHGELIEKIVGLRLKDEEFKASEKKKTKEARAMLLAMTKGKDYYKKLAGVSKDKKTSKEEPPAHQGLSQDEQFEISFLAGKGYSKHDLTMMMKIRKIYKEDGKQITLDDARKTSLFKAYKARNEAEDKKIKAQKGASHSGSPVSKDKKVEPKNEQEKRFVEEMDRHIAEFAKAAKKPK